MYSDDIFQFPREAVLQGSAADLALYILVCFKKEKQVKMTTSYVSYVSDIRKEVYDNPCVKDVLFKFNNSLSYVFLPKQDFDLGNTQ